MKIVDFVFVSKTISVKGLSMVVSDTIATKLASGHSLRARDTQTVPRFNTNYGKNAGAHRGPILWNAIIA